MFKSAERRRKQTRRNVLVLTGIGFLISAAIAAYVEREALTGDFIEMSVESAGAVDVTLEVEKVTLSQLVLTNVTLGASGPTVRRIQLDYSVSSLLNGYVDRVALSGVRALMRFEDTGFSVEGLGHYPFASDGPSDGEPPTQIPAVPFRTATLEDAIIAIQTPILDGDVLTAADVELSDQAWSLNANGSLQGTGGEIFKLSFTGGSTGTATANLTFTGQPFSLKNAAGVVAINGSLAATADKRDVLISGLDNLTVTLSSFAPAPQDDESAAVGPATFDTLSVMAASNAADQSKLARIKWGPDGQEIDLSLKIEAVSGLGAGTGIIDGVWSYAAGSGTTSSEVRDVSIVADALEIAGATWSGKASVGTLSILGDQASAAIEADVTLQDGTWSGTSVAEGRFGLQGMLTRTGESFAISLVSGSLSGASISLPDGTAIPGQAAVSIEPGSRLDWSPEGAMSLSGALSVAPVRIQSASLGGNATFGAQRVGISLASAEPLSGDLSVEGLSFSSPYARVTQVSGSAALRDNQWTAGINGQVRSWYGESGTPPVRRLELKGEGTLETAQVAGTLAVPSAPDLVLITGDFDQLIPPLGALKMTVPKDQFGASRPAAALHQVLSGLSGSAALSASIRFSDGRIQPSGTVVLDNAGWQSDALEAAAIFGVLTLDQIWPPESDEPQTVAIGQLNLGVPVTNGVLSLRFTGGGRGIIEEARFDFAGGQVSSDQFPFDLAPPSGKAVITVTDVDAAVLSALFGLDGLTANGRLSGSLPLSLRPDGAYIENGFIRAGSEGSLRYTPSTPPPGLSSGGASLMLDALENFQFDRLAVTLDGPLQGDLTAAVALAGKNPGLYGGYPIELNLNVEGALGQIARQSLAAYQVPDRIRQQIQSSLISKPRPAEAASSASETP